MDYYDQHLHTHHSFDSKESLTNYLNTTTKQLVTTEHLDFHNPADNFQHSLPNYTNYVSELNALQNTFERPILKGIEVGFVKEHQSLIEDFLNNTQYDVILLSTHQNGTIDFMDPVVRDYDLDELIHTYYTQMIASIEAMPYANILTHFDYGMRQLDLTVDIYRSLAEPYLDMIFDLIIKHQLALELNAKSFVRYGNANLYEYAIPRFIEKGGTLFTLGSDAHVADDYELGFKEMAQLLKNNNVKELATFQNQTLTRVPII